MRALTTQPNAIGALGSGKRPLALALLFLIVLFLAILLLVPGIADALDIQPHVYGLMFEFESAILGAWLVVLAVLWSRRRGKFDLFEPPVWFSLNLYVMVVLNVWLFQRETLPRIPGVRANYATLMLLTLLLFAGALTVFWGAYAWGYNRFSNRPAKPVVSRMRIQVVALIWIVGWIINIIFTGVMGTSSYLGSGGSVWLNYLAFIQIVTDTATVALVIHHFHRPRPIGWLWLGVVVLTYIAVPLLAGSKSFALSLMWMVIYIYYATNLVSKRWLVAGFIIIVLFVPVVNQYREILSSAGGSQTETFSGRMELLGKAISITLSQPVGSLFGSTRSTFERRQGAVLDISASVLDLTPTTVPYAGPEMAKVFFQLVIPRVLWPDKPTERPSLLNITSTYGGAASEYTFSEIGLAADSYRIGGPVTVAIWFVLMGLFCAWLYRYGTVRGGTAGLVFYVTILVHFIRYEVDITTTLLNLVQFAPLLWLIVMRVMFVHDPVAQTEKSLNSRTHIKMSSINL